MSKITYNKGDGIIEIMIRDETGARIESFKSNLEDKSRQKWIGRQLKAKYGIDFSVSIVKNNKDEGFFDF